MNIPHARTVLAAVTLGLVLLMFTGGCAKVTSPSTPGVPSNSVLLKVSQGMVAISSSVGTLQTTVINANAAGLISTADTTAILKICQQINAAGLQVDSLTRSYSTLPTGSVTITSVITPLVTAVQNAVATGLVGIKDATTKTTVAGILTTIQNGLTALQVVLGGL